MKPALVLRIVPICTFLLVGAALAQVQTAFVPDYFSVDRKTCCKRTLEWTFSPTGQVQGEIIGNITAPYTSAPLSGSPICISFTTRRHSNPHKEESSCWTDPHLSASPASASRC